MIFDDYTNENKIEHNLKWVLEKFPWGKFPPIKLPHGKLPPGKFPPGIIPPISLSFFTLSSLNTLSINGGREKNHGHVNSPRMNILRF